MGEPTIINCKVGVLNVAQAARDALGQARHALDTLRREREAAACAMACA